MTWAAWFTGLPGCGKSTLAKKTASSLREMGVNVRILHLDDIRKIITPYPAYTDEERGMVYRSLAYMAKLLVDEGINVIVDATANKREYGELARSLIPRFAEVYVKCTLEVCMEREKHRVDEHAPKGIYAKSMNADANVPGVNVPYEEPPNAEITVDTSDTGADKNTEIIVKGITELFNIQSA